MSTPPRHGSGAAMSLARLRVLLDAYGAAPSQWPSAERPAAEALLDSSAEARLMLAEATQLDALLDLARAPGPSAALAERLRERRFGWRGLAAVLWSERFLGRTRRWMVSPRHQIAAVAGALVIGILLGVGIPEGSSGQATSSRISPVRHVAVAAPPSGRIAVDTASRNGPTRAVLASTAAPSFSSNADPAFDAPDPFGAAAHGLDLVDGARINGIPVPRTGEPMGSIPLL